MLSMLVLIDPVYFSAAAELYGLGRCVSYRTFYLFHCAPKGLHIPVVIFGLRIREMISFVLFEGRHS